MTQVLVIDCRSRDMQAFVASATLAQADNPNQLVLRHALDAGGSIKELLAPTEWVKEFNNGRTKSCRSFSSDMPVLLMGGYEAYSSEGHVRVTAALSRGELDGHRQVTVVGGLGPVFGGGGLKVLGHPIPATLVRGPVLVEELAVAGNSNGNCVAAAQAGVDLLANIDRKAVFLQEGQSDHSYVVRFRPASADGETVFPVEHRSEMFSQENILRKVLFTEGRRVATRNCEPGTKPSAEEVKRVAKWHLKDYFSAVSAGEEESWKRLGRSFGLVSKNNEALEPLALEFGVEFVLIAPRRRVRRSGV